MWFAEVTKTHQAKPPFSTKSKEIILTEQFPQFLK